MIDANILVIDPADAHGTDVDTMTATAIPFESERSHLGSVSARGPRLLELAFRLMAVAALGID